MKRHIILLSVLFVSFLSLQAIANQSKRIEVYAISQSYWDVTPGETLGDIVKQILPDNPAMHEKLLADLLKLNPEAFSNSNPDNLKAYVRLWLPNSITAKQTTKNKQDYEVKSFDWGQVFKPKRD